MPYTWQIGSGEEGRKYSGVFLEHDVVDHQLNLSSGQCSVAQRNLFNHVRDGWIAHPQSLQLAPLKCSHAIQISCRRAISASFRTGRPAAIHRSRASR
jgi:hypothetical protein